MTDTINSDNSAVVARLEKRVVELEREMEQRGYLIAELDRQIDELERERDEFAMIGGLDENDQAVRMKAIKSLSRRDARVAAESLYEFANSFTPAGKSGEVINGGAVEFSSADEIVDAAFSEANLLRREAEGGE